MLLAGCQATALSGLSDVQATLTQPEIWLARSDFCQAAAPIYWGEGDTDETIRQVKAHNAVWKARCGPPAADDVPH